MSDPKNFTLRDFLDSSSSGEITDTAALEGLLFNEWNDFSGSSDGGMLRSKISGRLEKVFWQPPILKFSIERHGATVNGSTRAEVQNWEVDIALSSAKIVSEKRRQLYAMAKRMSFQQDAERIASDILNARESPDLKRFPDGRVKVLIGNIVPDVGYQQTVAGRRRRFRKALEKIISENGWIEVGVNTYLHK